MGFAGGCNSGFSGGPGGGGGGDLSGTLTPTILPVASGAHALADSHVQEVFTSGLRRLRFFSDETSEVRFESATGVSPLLQLTALGGDLDAPGVVGVGTIIGLWEGYGYDGAVFQYGGDIHLRVADTPGAGIMPAEWVFTTVNSAGVQGDAMTLDKDHKVVVHEQIIIEKTSKVTPHALSIVANQAAVNAALSDFFTLEVTDDVELQTPTNQETGRKFVLRLQMDDFAVTWAAGYRFVNNTAPTLDATAGSFTYLGFFYNDVDNVWDCIGPATGPFFT